MWETIQYYAFKTVGLASLALAVAAAVALAENVIARLKGGRRSRRT